MIGVYSLFVDKFPLGVAFNKALRIHMGQQHGQKYVPKLLEHWEHKRFDPAFVITHRLPLDDAPRAYRMFQRKEDQCVKVLLQP